MVNFDAESTDTIVFNKQKHFKQVLNGYPLNTFAHEITNGRLLLPSLAVIDEKGDVLEALSIYQHPKNLKPVLLYFGKDIYKTKNWNDFITEYMKPKK